MDYVLVTNFVITSRFQSRCRAPWRVVSALEILTTVFMDFTEQQNPRTDIDDEHGPLNDSWPRILIMSSTDEGKTLSTLSPFAIQKGVTGIAGDGVSIKRSQNGNITLTCGKKSQSENLLKCVLFGGLAPVSVTPHRTLNTCKGVIRNWELANTDVDEIKSYIPSIIDVYRIVAKRDGKEFKTNTLILTFNLPKIPSHLKVCYLNIPVLPYIPNPLRCYKCQTFGHTTNKCKKAETCARCSETGHNDKTCNNVFKCANCKETHAAYSKKCMYYKREFDIQSIRVKQSVSFFEARKIYQQTHGLGELNFSRAVRGPSHTPSVCFATQTDLTWNGSKLVKIEQPSTKPKVVVTTVSTNTSRSSVPSTSAASAATKPVSKTGKPAANAAKQAERKPQSTKTPPASDKQGNNMKSVSSAPAAVKQQTTTSNTDKVKKTKDKDKIKSTSDKKSPTKEQVKNLKTSKALKRTYHKSDFVSSTSSESSPARSSVKIKKVNKDVSFSNMVSRKRTNAADYFEDDNEFKSLCEEVESTLMSASDMKTNSQADRKSLKAGMIKLPI